MLSGSALKVLLGGVDQPITLSTPTRVEVELGWGCGWAVTMSYYMTPYHHCICPEL